MKENSLIYFRGFRTEKYPAVYKQMSHTTIAITVISLFRGWNHERVTINDTKNSMLNTASGTININKTRQGKSQLSLNNVLFSSFEYPPDPLKRNLCRKNRNLWNRQNEAKQKKVEEQCMMHSGALLPCRLGVH